MYFLILHLIDKFSSKGYISYHKHFEEVTDRMKETQALENHPLLKLQNKETTLRLMGQQKTTANPKHCKVQNRELFKIILLIHCKNLKDSDMEVVSENLNELTLEIPTSCFVIIIAAISCSSLH